MRRMQSARPAVFLDRDGTINVEREWLTDPADLELLPGVGEALSRLQQAGFALVVVTNQSAVARGHLDESGLERVHGRLRELLAAHGVVLDRIAYCPHHPSEGDAPYRRECDCRKPAPGMIRRAVDELGLDTRGSWLVGDAERDLDAARALGIPSILVATGKGAGVRRALRDRGIEPAFAVDMAAAAELILSDSAR
jgi:D-glycero-D-manno-heptose 1,7-bisphosphate phosphatase